eukprot:TRINITY_DN1248_c1_g1_i1.p2 TRINITY_DN1248_c1_g1~~TRINITY_DN1248_c1_g1_i1.p2  ORF type:complete len:269 (-),score=30.93 TRINITY_DN1248_c1_g1_i1:151-957(-)
MSLAAIFIVLASFYLGYNQECMPLQDLLETDQDLSLVNSALTTTQLNLTEIGDNLTMLLPQSKALQVVLAQYGVEDVSTLRDPFVVFGLRELLQYHVLPQKLYLSNLTNNMEIATMLSPDSPLCGDDVLDSTVKVLIDDSNITFIDDKQVNEEAKVFEGDIEVCEGVVHIIDVVLNPCCADSTHDCSSPGKESVCATHSICPLGYFCSANQGDGCKTCEDCLFDVDAVDGDCAARCGDGFPICEKRLLQNKEVCCARATYDFCEDLNN